MILKKRLLTVLLAGLTIAMTTAACGGNASFSAATQ